MFVYALEANELANRLFEHVVDPIIALLAFIALLIFVWTGVRYIYNVESSEKRGSLYRSFGIIIFGLFIIFSIYTIFSFVNRLAGDRTPIEGGNVRFEPYNTEIFSR